MRRKQLTDTNETICKHEYSYRTIYLGLATSNLYVGAETCRQPIYTGK
jgi:hypothetical protein